VKPFLKLSAVAFALVCLSGLAGDTSEAAQPSRKKVHRVHGHRIAHSNHIKGLKNGVHHKHTTRSGHRIHTHVKNGRLHGLHVTDKKGKSVPVQRRFVRRAKSSASLSPLDNDLIAQELAKGDLAGEEFSATQVGISVQVFVVFTFQINGQTVIIFFPASVCGGIIPNANGLPVDPNIPDDPGDLGGGDDLGF
jgi:hypothetical protein